MKTRLVPAADAAARILDGRPAMVAGNDAALRRLPRGNWIGGTMPYLVADGVGVHLDPDDDDRVLLMELPFGPETCRFAEYGPEAVGQIPHDAPDGALTLLIVPAFSAFHEAFAREQYWSPAIYRRPLAGWIAGVDLDAVDRQRPAVFSGLEGRRMEREAVAVHVELPADTVARIDIVNVFELGDGPVITVDEVTYEVGDCRIDGRPANLAHHIRESGVDPRLPLGADFCGATINKSILRVDEDVVKFYTPLFPRVEYRFARPVPDVLGALRAALPVGYDPLFAANCILNYVYGGFEGREVPGPAGPMTFGEIAYKLVNQTMVTVDLERVA